MAYVYRFIDKNDNVIYYGKTINIDRRISDHIAKGHLPNECYRNITRIEYQKYKTESDALIMETYYITKYSPKFNKLQQSRDTPVIVLEEGEWKLYREYKKQNARRYKTSITWKIIAFIYLIFAICYIVVIK